MEPVEHLRTIVVDDEQLARDELCFLLGQIHGVEVVAQAANGVEALRVIEEQGPDLVMLDVQMPGLTGFEVAKRLVRGGAESQLVFVTAYDQHAIEAFEVNAVDYLLKPVESGRLATAVDRVRRRIQTDRPASRPPRENLERLLQLLGDRQERREQLALKVGDRFLLVHSDEVVHASVEDDVITVATNSLSGTCNYRTLDELQARLDPAVFWRVHRSHLVNINRIKEILPWFSRNYILKMRDAKGTEIPVSRSQTRRLREVLEAMSDTNYDPYAPPPQPDYAPVEPMPAADPLVAPEPMVVAEPMPAIAGALVGVPTDGRLATDSGIGMARIAEEVVAWLKTLASAAVYATLIVTFGFQVARVEGQSMAPTLADQDRLIVNKLAYRIGEPHVGDIVMLYYPLNPDKSFVKRVIAEEGDQVRVVDGRVYRNDVPMDDTFVPSELPQSRRLGPAGRARGLLLRDGRPSQQQLGQPALGVRPEEIHHREGAAAVVAVAARAPVLAERLLAITT